MRPNLRTAAMFLAFLAPACAQPSLVVGPTLSPALGMDKRVATLIRRMSHRRTERKAFADLETLGCPAVPAIIAQMDNRRNLPDPNIALANKSRDAWESCRYYGPEKIVDALAAILNQITGHDFGFIYNGDVTDAERTAVVSRWRDWLSKTPPAHLCTGG